MSNHGERSPLKRLYDIKGEPGARMLAVMLSVLAVAGVTGIVEGKGGKSKAQQSNAAAEILGIVSRYDKEFHWQYANPAEFLTSQSPSDIKGLSGTTGKVIEGLFIQREADNTSLTLLASKQYPYVESDPYDVEATLVPNATQKTIAAAGIEFVPIMPVNCDVAGFHHTDPWDYSNDTTSSFTISLGRKKGNQTTVRVPLGTAQQSNLNNPLSLYLDPSVQALSSLPCNIETQPSGAPIPIRQFEFY